MDNLLVDNLIKLGMAVLIGGIVGREREFRDKAAGFRIGKPDHPDGFVSDMLKDPDIREFIY